MTNWNYVREESQNVGAGDRRFEVVSVEEKKTRETHKNMLVVGLKINGATFVVSDCFVEGEWFNKNVTAFLDSCGIKDGDGGELHPLTWVGAVGAARFKEDENGYLKRQYYLDPKRAEKLPAWVGEMPQRQTVTEIKTEGTDDDLPF